MKKYVEKSPQNATNVTTTYKGQHDHEPPTCRGVHHDSATNTQIMRINGDPENISDDS